MFGYYTYFYRQHSNFPKMTDDERHELVVMRLRLTDYLLQTQEQIIAYPIRADDADYQFLIRKAIYYQEMIDRIDSQLYTADD